MSIPTDSGQAEAFRTWFSQGLARLLARDGYQEAAAAEPNLQLVLHFVDPKRPRPYRRQAQATFVAVIAESEAPVRDALREAYRVLIGSLGNLMLYVGPVGNGSPGPMGPGRPLEVHFITLEQGHYVEPYEPGREEEFFQRVYYRLKPLACSTLVINNEFVADLEEELWNGDELTEEIGRAGKRLDEMGLLPAPFPLDEVLDERDRRHLNKLFGLGGLSYSNFSARKDATRFWMSASGVDKSRMREIGRDILMVKGYDPGRNVMELSVPPGVAPRRVSVDAIEHWMIYREHPQVGAILHAHAWIEGAEATPFNYPCGTLEMAQAVAEKVRQAPDPGKTVVGLKNHGLTITGQSLDEILERVGDRLVSQVPMS
ncbi:class II aldolase/adducin family protein [Limnochorda pilosa]|uniref:class II aldolase/adducin family protein n=1 Tax=Limnochorda pilosa TaxID=1555112 RepID=UPI00082C0EF3